MPTLYDGASALDRHLNFPISRTKTVSRRLQEVGILESGKPGISPSLSLTDFVSLLIAVASDTTLHKAAEAVRMADVMTPGGADVTGAPASIPRSARAALDALADMALGDLDDQRSVAACRIEFVETWREIALHADGTVTRFVPVGTLAGHWQAPGHRRSTTIHGGALVSAVRSLFAGD